MAPCPSETKNNLNGNYDANAHLRDKRALNHTVNVVRHDGKAEHKLKIDIDKFTEEELIDLNHRIVARLRFLNQMRAHSQMLDFRIGDRVTFQPEGRPALFGIVTRYNKKTVTVITDGGQQWNVAPGLLRKAGPSDGAENVNAKVIQLRKE